MTTPLVSIIITTKNEEDNVGNCLESIKAQAYPQEKIEIIVVDNSSIDKTKEIARKYTKKIYNQGPERSAQRNYGAQRAGGEWLLFLDADMILSPTLIEKGIKKAQKENLVACYIPEIILGTSFWCRVRRLERSFYDGTPIDAVRLIKTNVFNKIEGFDLSLTGPEDWDLDKRIRHEGGVGLTSTYNFKQINQQLNRLDNNNFTNSLFKISPKPILYHNEVDFNLSKYLAKKAYYSANFDKYIKKWGENDPDLKKQLGPFYRYCLVFIERGGWKKIIRFPHLMTGVFILKFLLGLNYLKQKIL
ncbi:MAG: glycosyltransferase [Patescibacteria group bacterium]|jgi:glycosyltransferase involved in cell wall biosynthesis